MRLHINGVVQTPVPVSGEDGASENFKFAVALADRNSVDAPFDSSGHRIHADLHFEASDRNFG